MDDDIIEALADAFADVLMSQKIHSVHIFRGIYECIVSVAVAIHDNEPTYDLRYFYKRAGYPEPYPIHDM